MTTQMQEQRVDNLEFGLLVHTNGQSRETRRALNETDRLLTPLPAANPGHSPAPSEGCLPVRNTTAGRVRRVQERSRVEPGGWRQVVGVALPLGSAAHLGGQRRVPGSRPARGVLPILQGSGHCRQQGVVGVMGNPASGEKGSGGARRGGGSAARAFCRKDGPYTEKFTKENPGQLLTRVSHWLNQAGSQDSRLPTFGGYKAQLPRT
ncbi:uncharacterized protein LOC124094625 [Marmota monax]|uniref:uncharacterized protein LOC124094625 n=1 Tax=Marmota monax TaxID=9995 RepID=UPI0026EAEB44|nr:uncharacterized protein LOC124094625 [Marmota monax]